MGRGRAKAKQTKVARQLKYSSGGTDLDALRAEIVGDQTDERGHSGSDDEQDDPYASDTDNGWDDERDQR